MRADAERNRARVLEVAAEAFAAEGLSVPVHEIARRAGVGTGTVSRHFPTKGALFAGVLLNRAEHMVAEARSLAAAKGPGESLFSFFTAVVKEGVANRGLSEALGGTDFDLETLAAKAGNSIFTELDRLLRRAQRAGEIRKDIDIDDLKALFKACSDRGRDTVDSRKQDRIVGVVFDGLRPNHRDREFRYGD